MSALEKVTGRSHGWMEFIFADFHDTGVAQQRIKRLAFSKHAERWADWWSKNWKQYVSNVAASFLFVTKEGTCGAFQLQSPISPPLTPGMPGPARGGWHYRFIYERGPEQSGPR